MQQNTQDSIKTMVNMARETILPAARKTKTFVSQRVSDIRNLARVDYNFYRIQLKKAVRQAAPIAAAIIVFLLVAFILVKVLPLGYANAVQIISPSEQPQVIDCTGAVLEKTEKGLVLKGCVIQDNAQPPDCAEQSPAQTGPGDAEACIIYP